MPPPPLLRNDENNCYINSAVQSLITVNQTCPRKDRPAMPAELRVAPVPDATGYYNKCAAKAKAKPHTGRQGSSVEAFQTMVEADAGANALLRGCLFKDVKCQRCANLSRTRMPFVVLDIPLNTDSGRPAGTIAECFLGLFRTSRVPDYQCDSTRCKGIHGPAEITHRMDEECYPRFFAIELQRGVGMSKRSGQHVEFGYELNITPRYTDGQVGDPMMHELVAVVMHTGSVGSGHYTSYQRRQDKWYMCDDSRPLPVVEMDGLVDDGSAVMLIYRRR
jgi:ubiquitin C-terminal hydrolase